MLATSRWHVLAGSPVALRISRNVSSGRSGANTSMICRILPSTSSGRIPLGSARGPSSCPADASSSPMSSAMSSWSSNSLLTPG